MDWDRMQINMARGNGFRGRGAADEQAFFDSFAGKQRRQEPDFPLTRFAAVCVAIVGIFAVDFMLR